MKNNMAWSERQRKIRWEKGRTIPSPTEEVDPLAIVGSGVKFCARAATCNAV